MSDSPGRQQLAVELRKLLLEAAQSAGADTNAIAENVASRVVAQLKPELTQRAPFARPEPVFDHALVSRLSADLRAAVAEAIEVGSLGRPGNRTPHQDSEPDDLHNSGRPTRSLRAALGGSEQGKAAEGGFWESAKQVSLAALGLSAVLLLATVLLWVFVLLGAFNTSAAASSGRQAAPAQTAQITPQSSWEAIAGDFPFSATLLRDTACGEGEGACDDWAEVRANLEKAYAENGAYVVKFGKVVADRSKCGEAPELAEKDGDVSAFLDGIEKCLIQRPAPGV